MDLEYKWILRQGKLSSIKVANMGLIYWFFHPVEEEEMGFIGYVILARCEFHFIREPENLV